MEVDYPLEKPVIIEVRMSVAIRVTVMKASADSDLEISAIRSVDLPSVQEIYESMDEDDFKAMNKAFAEASTRA